MNRLTAAALTIAGGAFYIAGGLTLGSGLTVGGIPVGLPAGIAIMTGGVLIRSMKWAVSIAGGALAIAGVLFAGVNGCGGLAAGLALTLIGSISTFRFSGRAPGWQAKASPEKGDAVR